MKDNFLKEQILFFLLFFAASHLLGQVQITNIDIKGTVYAVLPTAEGPVYYIQKNDDVIYKNKKNLAKLKMYDGHKIHDLHILGQGGNTKDDVHMDQLPDGSILIRFTAAQLNYLYDPVSNSLVDFESPIEGIKIFNSSIIDGAVYYSDENKSKPGEYLLIKYIEGEHEIVCKTDFYISKIFHNGDQYIFLIRRLLGNKFFPNYEWVQMDLECTEKEDITGMENLSSVAKYYYANIIEVARKGETIYFNKPQDLNANYKWDGETNTISRVDIRPVERQISRIDDKSNNITELSIFKTQEMIIELIKANGERTRYMSKLDYNILIHDMKGGKSMYELWVASNGGLLRIDLPYQTYKSMLLGESLRSIYPIDEEKLLVCTSGGNVFTVDRVNNDEGKTKRIYDLASDNRFIKTNSKNKIVFDGSWYIHKLNEDETTEKIYLQNPHPYTKLLTNDRLLVSTNTASNFIIYINSEQQDTSYLTDGIGKIIDCFNIDPTLISISSSKGISIYDLDSNKITFQDSSKRNSLSGLLVDGTDLYVGYEDGTLRNYEYLPGRVTLKGEWNINKGFGIAKIIHTREKRLWLTTFDGVCIFNMRSEEIRYLDKDKLSAAECNRYSGYYDSLFNRVYIGTIDGLNVINEEVEDEQIDSFKCFFLEESYSLPNKDSIIYKNIFYDHHTDITLPSMRRNLTLSFASGYSTSQNKITYQYRLNEEKWQSNEDNNMLRFSYLKSGSNKIEIRATHSDRYVSENTLVANVFVTPFIYERWWFRFSILMLLSGGIWFWYRRMKTENVRLEKAVENRTEELKRDKVIIEKQAQDLGELDKLKNQFFANVSHELRTPLTLLISPIERISTGTNLTEEQKNLLDVMKDHGHLLQNRISELLELSRLTSKKVELKKQKINLERLIELSTTIFEPLAQKKGIRFIVEKKNVAHKIMGDENRLSKIIQNLIINAIKFSNNDGDVQCSFSVDDDILKIEIKDNGIGIKKEFLDKIFQRFYQVPNTNILTNPGTGIGLAMVSEYVELMNGSISVKSKTGIGTTFNIELPIQIAPPVSELPDNYEVIPMPITFKPIDSKQKPKLLIAEDNESLRNYLHLILKEYFDIVEAENGKIALDLLQSDSELDIILSDIMMPEMDGVALLEEVRNDDILKLKPFVFLTAKHNEKDIANAFRLGVDDYLKKPFSEKVLIYRLNAVYANYKSRIEFVQDEHTYPEDDLVITEPTSDFIAELQEIIVSNIQSPEFSLEFLAEKLNTSKSTLIRMVKKEIGLTPNKFILEIRLNKARQLYESGESLDPHEIASQVGFSTGWYFQKLYTERFGVELVG